MGELYELLHSINSDLGTEEVEQLIYLCKDLLPHISRIKDGTDLFIRLQENGLLNKEDKFIILELLYYIRRYDLLQCRLNTDKEMVEAKINMKRNISPFRYLLFYLSEEVVVDGLEKTKTLLEKTIPKARMEQIHSMLDIFTELENKSLLQKDKLDVLKNIFNTIDENLLKNIEGYEESWTDTKKCQDSRSNVDLPKNPSQITDVSQPIEETYAMSRRPCGTCIIISNFNFEVARKEHSNLEHLKDRHGTERDAEALEKVFSSLNFEVFLHKDLTQDEVLQKIQYYSRQKHENRDCFICCILSHGNKGVIYGTDGQQVAIRDLTHCFQRSKCPSLAGKPKVFFIQACQGGKYHQAQQLEADACNADGYDKMETDFIPNEPDFLLGMATIHAHVSYRHRTNGAWYIQSLCKHLEERCPRGEDMLSILTLVNNEVSQKYDPQNNAVQMPQPCTTLCKKLVFCKPSSFRNHSFEHSDASQ
ncbi:caspase-8-like [Pelodytes ibericus]